MHVQLKFLGISMREIDLQTNYMVHKISQDCQMSGKSCRTSETQKLQIQWKLDNPEFDNPENLIIRTDLSERIVSLQC